MRTLILTVLCCGLLGSCREFFVQEIDDPGVPFEPQLVLYTILQPQDTVIIVDVRLTAPAIGASRPDADPREALTGATVTISDGRRTYPLTYSSASFRNGYRISTDEVGLVPGESYSVEVSYENLTASGEVTIPSDTFGSDAVRFQFTEEAQGGGFTERLAFVSVPNAPGADDYYLLLSDRNSIRSDSTLRPTDRSLIDWIHGRTIVGPRINFESVPLGQYSKNTIRVCRTTAATFDYLESRDVAFTNGDNPFAEPTQVYSNVTGGLGVVGAAQCKLYVVR